MFDLLALGAAGLGAYLVRFEGWPPEAYARQMAVVVPLLAVARLGYGHVAGIGRMSWRLFGLREALGLARVIGLGTVLLLLWRGLAPPLAPAAVLPLGVIVLEGLFALGSTAGMRIAVRWWDEDRERRRAVHARSSPRQRALLVGAGRAGQQAARALRHRPDAGYEPVGFLDDDPARHGQVIEGLTVLGGTEGAALVAGRVGAEAFILTMQSASRAERRRAAERCRATGLTVCTVPSVFELVAGRVGITEIRPLRVEDLLGREPQRFDVASWEQLRRAVGGRRALVTGAGGSIGSELCRQLVRLGVVELVMVDHHENSLFEIEAELRESPEASSLVPALLDVRDADRVASLLREHPCDLVFHAAAFKHVPMMEQHPAAAVDNNVRGTRVLLEAAEAAGVERFVLVSTDKAVAPRSVMGASKRVAELVVQAHAGERTRASAVRFGNVLGSQGSVLHTFRRQIERGGPVTVTHPEATRFFMTIPEAVRLVIQAAVRAEGRDVFMLEMGEPVRILDLAREMIRLADRGVDEIEIEMIGLRPGEKLHEQLVCPGEGVEPSGVEGILRARPTPVEGLEIGPWVARLEAAARRGDVEAIFGMLSAGAGYRPDPSLRAAGAGDGGDDSDVLAAG